MDLNKQNCIASLAASFARTSRWRRIMQGQYPNDPRHLVASERLTKLVDEVMDLTDDQWARLQPFWSSERWNDAVSQAARHVEMRPHVRTLQGVLNDLVTILAEQKAAA